MQQLKSILSGRKSVDLFSIEYKSMNSSEKITAPLKLSCQDFVSVYDKTSTKLTVKVTRNLKFDPEALFQLSISYLIHHYVKDEFLEKVDWESYDLDNEITNDCDYFAGIGTETVSLLIGQITSSFGRVPIITNPLLNLNPKKDPELRP
ncbi:MAG: hypothetical protein QM289_02680 [Bacillota bacterium]|jgi:hypothetical protein|nr:hypothetical protein [Bacillota bacterium]